MPLITKNLLTNFILILTPIFLINLYVFERKYNLSGQVLKKIFTFGLSLSIVLAMSFSFELTNGLLFDFRTIPFIIGILYFGPKSGGILLGILLTYRFLLGGEGEWIAFITYTILYGSSLFLRKRFLAMSIRKRYILIVGLMIFAVLTLSVVSSIFAGSLIFRIEFWLVYGFVNVIGALAFVHIIEVIIQNYQLRGSIVHNEKLEVVSQLAASIAHEVRNPLTTINGVVQLLLKDDEYDRNKQKELLKLAFDEVQQAENVISDYLLFARPSSNKIESVSIKETLEHSVEMIRPMANANGVIIEKELSSNFFVKGESQKLYQCFLNLMKNGIEAMTDGGVLTVVCEEIKGESKVKISIKDTGMGMSKQQLERIGNPYYTTKESGTGLGMMVVFSIIEGMAGKVSVNSTINKGTEFIIHIPLYSTIGDFS